jgi:hypothetical protein
MRNNRSGLRLWLPLAALLLGTNAALACDEFTRDASGEFWCYQNCSWDVKNGIRRCDMTAMSIQRGQPSEDIYASLDSLRTAVSEGRYVGTPLQLEEQLLAATATVEQTSCKTQEVVSFDRLSSAERILIRTAADALVYGEQTPEDAGCSVYEDGVECHAFGYVCWVDSESSGCSKETC